MTLVATIIPTPVGPLTVVASNDGLRAVLWSEERDGRVRLPEFELGEHAVLTDATVQLGQYFAGERVAFELPLDLVGTEFQLAIWRGLAQIPHGATSTYAAEATRVGRPAASRAAGGAIGRNPVSIVLPCHRVIGASGALTGFAGGVGAKRWLLEHEGVRLSA